MSNTEYLIDDYYKKNIFLDNAKKIIIINQELKLFFDIIRESLDLFIENLNYYNHIKSIIISFEYKDNKIEYCLYEDDYESVFIEEKINIINKNGYSFETYTKNYEEKLIKIFDLKSVSIKEFSDFFKDLFACVLVKIL
jgi:hypothetical protein